ncbi:Methylesterase [Penicillium chrysogenum]|uniref:Methylesterase n=1 Tax=Penicillium chrysogenum TaxID=5076 RepID=A0A167S1B4_PENCH|nr:Methylesterase [Penicillium chrysogenum]
MSSTAKPTILLVHGAWHGSWCRRYQIPALEAFGYDVETVDLPCVSGVAGTTQFDDAAHVRAVVESQTSMGKRVVVLAHSYAGPIASAAIKGLSGKGVLGMVALCAYIFPGGMDQGAVIRDIGDLPYVTWNMPSKGLFQTKDPRSLFFPPDVPAERVDWAVAQLRPQSMAANMGIVPPQAWQDDTYTGRLGYIRCTADVVIPIEQQGGMVLGAGGQEKWVVRTLEGSGHSPFLSRPHEVAAALDEIVNAFEAKV